MKIILETIPHNDQRYPTCGDYFIGQDGTLHILVSETGNNKYNYLVMLHELIESFLCASRGIPYSAIDEFDIAFEKARMPSNDDEPGDDPKAPYYREHQTATIIERQMALELGVNWKDYDKTINELE